LTKMNTSLLPNRMEHYVYPLSDVDDFRALDEDAEFIFHDYEEEEEEEEDGGIESSEEEQEGWDNEDTFAKVKSLRIIRIMAWPLIYFLEGYGCGCQP